MSNVLKIAGAGVSAAAVPSDADFENTVLLLHGDGTNGAQNNTFLDSSTNNFTITRNGNTTQGTFSPFSKPDGAWGNYFDGTGDYLSVPNDAAIQLDNSTAFTIECWIYFNAFANQNILRKIGTLGPFAGYGLATGEGGAATNTLVFFVSGTGWITVKTGLVTGQWYHFAATYEGSGTTLRFFLDGVQQGSAITCNSGILNTSQNLNISGSNDSPPTNHFTGYISSLRIVKGTAVYTAAFTPPTAPLTAISGTSLLTCQSNRFIDNSSNNFAITRNGDVKVTPFSPFPITTAYYPSVNGGSGYFDGSGDYLSVARNSALTPAGDFTYEVWVYPTATPDATHGAWLGGLGESGDGNQFSWTLKILSNLTINFYIRSTNVDQNSTETVKLNQWNYIAVTRQGSGSNNLLMVVNGVSKTFTDTGSLVGNGTPQFTIGADTNGDEALLTGYVSGARLLSGTGYTSLSIPTAPPTAITNTSFLANFTNAGILDNTGFNNLETVGNAQIDTSVKKYGTGAMKFDGTGDWLRVASNDALSPGGGDFTIECWLYPIGNSNYMGFYQNYTDGSGRAAALRMSIYETDNTRLVVQTQTTALITTATSVMTANAWNHVALVRNGGGSNNLVLYVNGTSAGTATNTTNFSDGFAQIGNTVFAGVDYTWNGLIDDFRITKGIARYTTTFTPPTAALPDIGA